MYARFGALLLYVEPVRALVKPFVEPPDAVTTVIAVSRTGAGRLVRPGRHCDRLRDVADNLLDQVAGVDGDGVAGRQSCTR